MKNNNAKPRRPLGGFLLSLTQNYRIIVALQLLSFIDIAKIVLLTIAVVIFEAGGLALLLPVLSFIKNGQDPAKFAADTAFGQHVHDAYQMIGIPLNFITLSLVVLFMITLRQLLNYFLTIQVDKMKVRVARDVGLLAFSDVMKSTVENIEKYKIGQFSSILTHEAQSCGALLRVYCRLFNLVLTFTIYFSAMIFISPLASFGSIMIVVSISFLMGYFGQITRELSNRRIKTRAHVLNFFNERLKAWKLIKLADTIELEKNNAYQLMQKDIETEFKVGVVGALIQLIMAPLVVFCALVSVYYAIETFKIDIDTVAAFFLILLRLIPVGQGFNSTRHSLISFTSSIVLLDQVIHTARDARESKSLKKLAPPLKSSLEFENVSFKYPGSSENIFLNTSFIIPANSITAVVGSSGSGKTTLIDILTRIRNPDQGKVLFDGVSISEFDMKSYRDRLVCMSQETLLFDGAASDAIRYFNQSASSAEIREAASLAGAHDFIKNLNHGYETQIGENGFRLSGGEKQRIDLARMFLSKAQIVILDEPTSALDAVSETKALKSIKKLSNERGCTVVMITHRLPTVKISDQVLQIGTNGSVSMMSIDSFDQNDLRYLEGG